MPEDVFDLMEELRRDLDRFLSYVMRPRPLPVVYTQVWEPRVDLFEEDQAVTVIIEVAGARRDSLSVSLEGERLIVSGTRPIPLPSAPVCCHRIEIAYGPFYREVAIPVAVDATGAQASYRDGLLLITLPKAGAGRPHKVAITVQEGTP